VGPVLALTNASRCVTATTTSPTQPEKKQKKKQVVKVNRLVSSFKSKIDVII
jgi:hypothetical protein